MSALDPLHPDGGAGRGADGDADRPTGDEGTASKYLPLIVAATLIGSVAIVGLVGAGGGSGAADEGPTPSDVFVSSSVPAAIASPSSTEAPVTSVAPLAGPLIKGAHNDDVVRLQTRLAALGFQPGPIDGSFGDGTQQAVWAFKKLLGNENWADFKARDDQTTVDEVTWQAMNDPAFAVSPRRPNTGRHIEIYLPLQVLALFDADNEPIFVAHISTGELNPDGTDATFCEDALYDTDIYGQPLEEPVKKPICAEAKTPPGVFQLQRYHEGSRQSPLGGMKNPWYFNYGIAIHGAYNVPNYPASHGCIRISNDLANVFPTLVGKGDAVYVWGYDGREPEGYSKNEMLPSFNREDPTRTTTTTSTTTTSTTVPPTTVAPTTAPPTTQAPATTTTTEAPAPATTTTVPTPTP